MTKAKRIPLIGSEKKEEFPRLNESRSTLTRKLSMLNNTEAK